MIIFFFNTFAGMTNLLLINVTFLTKLLKVLYAILISALSTNYLTNNRVKILVLVSGWKIWPPILENLGILNNKKIIKSITMAEEFMELSNLTVIFWKKIQLKKYWTVFRWRKRIWKNTLINFGPLKSNSYNVLVNELFLRLYLKVLIRFFNFIF